MIFKDKNSRNKHNIFKRALVLSLLFFVIVFSVAPAILTPSPVRAADDAPAAPAAGPFDDIGAGISRVSASVWYNIKSSIAVGGAGALVGWMQYFSQKLAYDMANILTLGGDGSVLQSKYWSELGKDYVNDVGSRTLELLPKTFLGLGLCEPPNIGASLALQLGFRNINRPDNNCQFDFFNGLSGFKGSTPSRTWATWYAINKERCNIPTNKDKCLEQFGNSLLDTNTTELGIAAKGTLTIGAYKANLLNFSILEALLNKNVNPRRDPITKDTVTPQQVFDQTVRDMGPISRSESILSYQSELLSTDELWSALLSTFTTTFTSVFINNLGKAAVNGIYALLPDDSDDPSKGIARGSNLYNSDRSAAARDARVNPILLQSPTTRQIEAYNVVSRMGACSAESGNTIPHPEECVIDGTLYQELLSSAEKPFTIHQALTDDVNEQEGNPVFGKNVLHGDWELWGPNHPLNGTVGCRNVAYCYSNLTKLRKARILPLGFEIAALRSTKESQGQPWKLKDVVANFNNYAFDDQLDANGRPVLDSSGQPVRTLRRDSNGNPICVDPFQRCGLIDPNWIIKAPLAACGASGSGSLLAQGGTSVRHDVCSDLKSCLAEDGGTCTGGFGYCTKERKLWRIAADTCPAQFNTCQTFAAVDTKGNAGKQIAYLTRTLDFGVCTADNVGCREYMSFKQGVNGTAEGTWTDHDSNNLNTRLFLSGKAEPCTAKDKGCTALVLKADSTSDNLNTPVNLKIAPNYLNCYAPSGTTVEQAAWPQNTAELQRVLTSPNRSAQCNQYAGVCTKEEIGCSLYTPTSFKGPAVPGVAKDGDKCDASCVGYDAYRQLPTENGWDVAENSLTYFIPKTAQACPRSEIGCDQFVNIDAQEKGGEALSYYKAIRSCRRPEDVPAANQGVFYSWIGSEQKGYELISYNLVTTQAWRYVTNVADPATVSLERQPAGVVVPAPEYVGSYDDDTLQEYGEKCNQYLYQRRETTPDCRELFDAQGNVFYRLLSHTTTINSACSPLRKSEPSLAMVSGLRAAECTAVGGEFRANGAGADDDSCAVCRGGGVFQNGQCVYWALQSESLSCQPQYSGCREYAGNFAANVEVSYNETFENVDTAQKRAPTTLIAAKTPDECTTAGGSWVGSASQCRICTGGGIYQVTGDIATDSCLVWQSTTLASESTSLGGKSLKVQNGSKLYLKSLTKGDYEVRFWARGVSGGGINSGRVSFTVAFTGGAVSNVEVTSNWSEAYRLGPVEVAERTNNTVPFLEFSGIPGTAAVFIDNIQVIRIQSSVQFVKNSWSTPLVCDPNPADTIPGPQLGCQMYKDSNGGQNVPLKSFAQLCRSEAVGCKKFTHTYNSDDAGWMTYNVVCGAGGAAGPDVILDPGGQGNRAVRTCQYNARVIPAAQVATTPTCTIPVGYDTCFVAVSGKITNAQHVGQSTVYVPQDQEVYVVDTPAMRCQNQFVGCTELGRVEKKTDGTTSFTTTYVVNNPKDITTYQQKLCSAPAVGCSEYERPGASGSKAYFKDPAVLGRKVCEYREQVQGSLGVLQSGWFVKGGDDPCYPQYILPGNQYALWSQADLLYDGSVGECKPQFSGCKQLIDHADTTVQGGRSYFVIANEKLAQAATGCPNGQVSLQDGCVLLDDKSNPEQYWQTSATYENYEARGGFTPVAPVTSFDRTENDANVVLKVNIDRECGEWLSCASTIQVFDPATSKTRSLCSELALCSSNKLEDGTTSSSCTTYKDSDYTQPLTDIIYQSRATDWYGLDLSGYSFVGDQVDPNVTAGRTKLLGRWQIGNIRFVRVGDDNKEDKIVPAAISSFESARRACQNVPIGRGQNGEYRDCVGMPGKCIDGLCVQPLFGGNFPQELGRRNAEGQNSVAHANNFPNLACRVYPDKIAPFAPSVVLNWNRVPGNVDRNPNASQFIKQYATVATESVRNIVNFEKSNVCQEGYDCECRYDQIDYGNGLVSRYYGTWKGGANLPVEAPSRPSGVCDGGEVKLEGAIISKKGWPCRSSLDCKDEIDSRATEETVVTTGGTCLLQNKVTQKIGMSGYCLEYDRGTITRGAGPESANEQYCQTWLPLDYIPGTEDIYNQFAQAGFSSDKNIFHCLQSKGEAVNDSELRARFQMGAGETQSGGFEGGYCVVPEDLGNINEYKTVPPDHAKYGDRYRSVSLHNATIDFRIADAFSDRLNNGENTSCHIVNTFPRDFGADPYGPSVDRRNIFRGSMDKLGVGVESFTNPNVSVTADRGVEAFGACWVGWVDQEDGDRPGIEYWNMNTVRGGANVTRWANNRITSQVRFREIKREEVDKILVVFNWNMIPRDKADRAALDDFSGGNGRWWCRATRNMTEWDDPDFRVTTNAGSRVTVSGDATDDNFESNWLHDNSPFPHPFAGIWVVPGEMRMFGGQPDANLDGEDLFKRTNQPPKDITYLLESDKTGLSFEGLDRAGKVLKRVNEDHGGALGDDVNNNGKFKMLRGDRVTGLGQRADVYNIPSGAATVVDDPMYSDKPEAEENGSWNKNWQMISEGVGDEWHIRYRGPQTDQNLLCNSYDFFTAGGDYGRNALFGSVTGDDGQVGDGKCLQIKFWFDNNDVLQMDWDNLIDDNSGKQRDANAFKVYVYLKDQCVAVARTYDPQRPSLSIPWTNKLWKNDKKEDSEKNATVGSFSMGQTDGIVHPQNPDENLNFAREPYGAARSLVPPAGEKWFSTFDPVLADDRYAVVTGDFSTALDDNRRAGLPFSVAGFNTIISGDENAGSALETKSPIVDGVSRLNRVFFKLLDLWVWDKTLNNNKGGYAKYPKASNSDPNVNLEAIGVNEGVDRADELDEFTKEADTWIASHLAVNGGGLATAPFIQSFDPRSCNVSSKGGYPVNKCEPKHKNAFNVNGKDGVTDDGIVFGVGDREVDIQFYATADSNQMPIRHIALGWNDVMQNTESIRLTGLYRNHKPFCASNSSAPVNSCDNSAMNWTCTNNTHCALATNDPDPLRRRDASQQCEPNTTVAFGNSPDACEENYFSFKHRYVFNELCPGLRTVDFGLPEHQLLRLYGMRQGQRFCEYKPSVLVVDNWGVCNGEKRNAFGRAIKLFGSQDCKLSTVGAGQTYHGRVIVAERATTP